MNNDDRKHWSAAELARHDAVIRKCVEQASANLVLNRKLREHGIEIPSKPFTSDWWKRL